MTLQIFLLFFEVITDIEPHVTLHLERHHKERGAGAQGYFKAYMNEPMNILFKLFKGKCLRLLNYLIICTKRLFAHLFPGAHGVSAGWICGDLFIWVLNQCLHHSCRCSCSGFPAQIYAAADSTGTLWSIFTFQSKPIPLD